MRELFSLKDLFPWDRLEGHGSLTKTKSEQKENEEITPERAFQIFFLSYRFSQGSNGLQQNIWSYIHATHPQWRITDETEQVMKEKALPVFEKFLWGKETLHPPLSPKTLTWAEGQGSGLIGEGPPREIDFKSYLSGNIDKMRDIFNADVNLTKREKHEIVGLIAEGIIEKDYRFLNRHRRDGGGRPRSKETESLTRQADPFLSHICYYALEQQSTGSPEYDEMFQDVGLAIRSGVKQKKQFLIKGNTSWSFKWDLAHIVFIYQDHHPENGLDAFFQNLLRSYPELKKDPRLRTYVLHKRKDV